MVLLLKNILFTFLVPATVAVYVPLLLAAQRPCGAGLRLAIALVLLSSGAAVYLWCLWDFATFGRGTPAPVDAPKRLVVRGLYRYTRNPMYLGVLTAILGWTLLFGAWELCIYAMGMGLCFHLFVVFYEEPHLRSAFGADYEAYCTRVGRWLPPVFRTFRM